MKQSKRLSADIADSYLIREYGGLIACVIHPLSKGEINHDLEKLSVSASPMDLKKILNDEKPQVEGNETDEDMLERRDSKTRETTVSSES